VGSINFYYPNSFNIFFMSVRDNFLPVAFSKMLCTVIGFMSFPPCTENVILSPFLSFQI